MGALGHRPCARPALHTEFDRLRCARRFCEAVDSITAWSRHHAEIAADHELGMALHRTALRVTDRRPDLRVVGTDEPSDES